MDLVMDLDIILALQDYDLDQELLNTNEYVITELLGIINNFTTNNTEYEQFLQFEDKPIVLSKTELNKIPFIHYSKIHKDTECSICLESFILDEDIKVLNCQHIFHPDCINNWLTKCKTTCPVCRKDQRL
jgi:hypothetical protein